MSFESEFHSIQAIILHTLLMKPEAAFAELQKQTGLTSDHFSFHLKRLADNDLIEHTGSHYRLSIRGKEFANRMDTNKKVIERQPKSAVVLIIYNDNGQFLAQQRLKQPFYGFWGRPTGKIRWGEKILEAAARELKEETNLTAQLELKGIYHKLDYLQETGELLEDKLFYIVCGAKPLGELLVNFEGGRNAWMTLAEVEAQPRHFAGLSEAAMWVAAKHLKFVERRHFYTKKEY